MLLNYNTNGYTWKKPGVTSKKVLKSKKTLKRNELLKENVPELWSLQCFTLALSQYFFNLFSLSTIKIPFFSMFLSIYISIFYSHFSSFILGYQWLFHAFYQSLYSGYFKKSHTCCRFWGDFGSGSWTIFIYFGQT